ncbi:Eef1akmt4 [Scenedesmus sp. PABB004]|nr:Eef1akmt4 [Scenedesmus sp. PABB004]
MAAAADAAAAAAPAAEEQQRAPPSLDRISPLCRLFLRQEWAKIDPALPRMLDVLTEVGSAECFHKKSTFKAHLVEVYKMLKLWGASDAIARCGLMHSAYSNSFVNLAIFKPDVERRRVAELIGDAAEELTHLFCVVPRQRLIQVELLDAQPLGTAALEAPPGGMTVPHIRTGEPLHVSTYHLAVFLLMTMVDFAEQLYSWQDCMFGNTDGRLRLEGAPHPEPRFLWPGPMRPGLWMSAVSRMGQLYMSCRRQLIEAGDARVSDLPVPPVFDGCSCVLPEADQEAARDAYWAAVSDVDAQGPGHADAAAAALRRAAELNPWAGEPRLMLAQLHLHAERWRDAADEAAKALDLLCAWGTAYDKRMSWDAWVAFARLPRTHKPMAYTNPALFSSDDQFSERVYWDNRYKSDPTTFEWYLSFKTMQPVLDRHLPKDQHLLQLGVGTSRLQVDMADAGWRRVTSTDFSTVAVERMQGLYAGYEGRLDYEVADARRMPQFTDGTYGGVLDKGCLDALLCGDAADADAAALLREAWRVLRPGAAYVWVTSGGPRARLPFLVSPATPWASLQVSELGQQGVLAGPFECSGWRGDADSDAGGDEQLREALQLPRGGYSHMAYVCVKPRADQAAGQDASL